MKSFFLGMIRVISSHTYHLFFSTSASKVLPGLRLGHDMTPFSFTRILTFSSVVRYCKFILKVQLLGRIVNIYILMDLLCVVLNFSFNCLLVLWSGERGIVSCLEDGDMINNLLLNTSVVFVSFS